MGGPWEKYATPPAGPWDKYASAPMAVATPDPNGDAMRQRIAAAKAGTLQVSGESADRARAADEIAMGDMQAASDARVLEQTPAAVRYLTKAAQGVPFVGEYYDEATGALAGALGGDSQAVTRDVRAVQEAMDRQHPIGSAAAQIGGGVVGGALLARAAGPAVVAAAPVNLAARVAGGVLGGAALGGVEGAVSGYGAGNDGDRAGSAFTRGAVGAALGGVIGGAIPAVGAGISRAYQRFKGSDVATIARELGVSDDAARVIKRQIEADDLGAAQAAISRGGDSAMLADASPGTQRLLDASAQFGGKAPALVRDAVEGRAKASAGKMQDALDAALGPPEPVGELGRQIRAQTAAAREAAYSTAYASPIDYASQKGMALESLLKRVPGAAVKRANELMRLEGAESAQIMARIADDGAVTLERMPDVRQLDYITRALNDVADAADGQGKLGGTTALGRATGNLSKAIRTTLRDAVPAYGEALDTAADAISRSKAAELGYDMLRASTKRETVFQGLRGASKAEIAAAKSGLRSYIDDTLANVRASITSPDLDINEFRKMTGDLRTRAAQDKVAALLGKTEADALYKQLDAEVVSLELRAALAQNSKTAARAGVQQQVQDITAPGVLRTLAQGEPINATKRLVQALTGTTPEAVAVRQAGIYDEIAQALVGKTGSDARVALAVIDRARSGQAVTDAQARVIARAVGYGVATAGVPLTGQAQRMSYRALGR